MFTQNAAAKPVTSVLAWYNGGVTMRTIFDNILLDLADCAKTHNSTQTQRLECDITDKYNAGLLSSHEFHALYGVAFSIREEIFSK